MTEKKPRPEAASTPAAPELADSEIEDVAGGIIIINGSTDGGSIAQKVQKVRTFTQEV